MEIIYHKSFLKDIKKLSWNDILKNLTIHIVNFKNAENISSIKKCKKLKWFLNNYRIRIWDYRLWFR